MSIDVGAEHKLTPAVINPEELDFPDPHCYRPHLVIPPITIWSESSGHKNLWIGLEDFHE